MDLNYNSFKEWATKRDFGDFRHLYIEVTRLIDSLYPNQEFKFFYPRNIWNTKNKEFILFVEDGYIVLNKVDNDYVIQHFVSELKSKTLKTSKYHNVNQQLILEFRNGETLSFHSTKDSSEDWEEEYSEIIRNLYKTI